MRGAWACDSCGETAPVKLFPAGWLRLHVYGRPESEAYMSKQFTVDVCSPECAVKAIGTQ